MCTFPNSSKLTESKSVLDPEQVSRFWDFTEEKRKELHAKAKGC